MTIRLAGDFLRGIRSGELTSLHELDAIQVHLHTLHDAAKGELDSPPGPGNELLSNVVQIITDDLRLWADWQNIIADSLDKRRFPPGGDGAKRVPCVAGDKTKLRGLNAEFLFHMGVNLGCRFVALHAVHAKEPFEKIDDAAMFQLASLYLN